MLVLVGNLTIIIYFNIKYLYGCSSFLQKTIQVHFKNMQCYNVTAVGNKMLQSS